MAGVRPTVHAQPYQSSLHSITIHDGLAGESVYRIFKSKWGVMWIATTNGVNYYDGHRLFTYRVGHMRSQNKIVDVAESDDETILCASACGIYKVDGTKQRLQHLWPSLTEEVNRIRVIEGKIYLATVNGLYIADSADEKATLRHVWMSRNHLDGQNEIKDIEITSDHRIWLLGKNELFLYDAQKEQVRGMGLPQQIQLSNSMRMMAAAGSRLFIGTYNDGVFVYDTEKHVISRYKDVGCPVITSLSVVRDKLYIGTDGAGLHSIDWKNDSTMEIFSTHPDSRLQLKDNTVYAFYHDTTGVNFFGYFRQGLQYNHYAVPLFRCYTLHSRKDGRLLFDSRHVNVRSICIDGKIKVLGSRGGLYYIDEEQELVKFFPPEELGGSIVTQIIKYAGQYYCCTFNGGVMRIDPTNLTISRFGSSQALRTSSFGMLKVSPDNELWMAGNAGIYIYNAHHDTERHLDSHNSSLPEAYCNDILFDRQDRCWISTDAGLCLYTPLDKRIHTKGFPADFFHTQRESHAILGDRDNLLFYSLDGIFRTNEEMTQYNKVSTRVSTVNNYVSQAIYDRHRHNYWIATEQGMFRFDDDFDKFTKYADEAGLASNEFSYGAIHIDTEGMLWTGTMQGLYSVPLDKVIHYSIGQARITMEDVTINSKAATDTQNLGLMMQQKIRLPYHWGIPSFGFAPVLLNYSNQHGLCFEYRLKGTAHPWQTLLNGEKALIKEGLHLGHNTLEIKIAGEKKAVTYHISVYPSALFVLELLALFTVILIVVIVIRQRRDLRRQREEMQRVQKELEETKRKYRRLNTTDDEQQRLYQRLQHYMKTEKPYLNADLKLSDLASLLECSTVKLSQMLNTYAQSNYYDFINSYRIQEFKERLTSPAARSYTVLALAEECGFKRSSFFTAFKKMEGITPMAYVKQHGGSY